MTKAQPSPLNVSRGLRCAILSGLLGAVAPVALVLGGTVCGWLVSGTSEWDRQADLQELPNSMLDVAIGWRRSLPARDGLPTAPLETYRFARSLAIIFSISLLLWFIMITVVLPPRYGLKGRESMVNGLPSPPGRHRWRGRWLRLGCSPTFGLRTPVGSGSPRSHTERTISCEPAWDGTRRQLDRVSRSWATACSLHCRTTSAISVTAAMAPIPKSPQARHSPGAGSGRFEALAERRSTAA